MKRKPLPREHDEAQMLLRRLVVAIEKIERLQSNSFVIAKRMLKRYEKR